MQQSAGMTTKDGSLPKALIGGAREKTWLNFYVCFVLGSFTATASVSRLDKMELATATNPNWTRRDVTILRYGHSSVVLWRCPQGQQKRE